MANHHRLTLPIDLRIIDLLSCKMPVIIITSCLFYTLTFTPLCFQYHFLLSLISVLLVWVFIYKFLPSSSISPSFSIFYVYPCCIFFLRLFKSSLVFFLVCYITSFTILSSLTLTLLIRLKFLSLSLSIFSL